MALVVTHSAAEWPSDDCRWRCQKIDNEYLLFGAAGLICLVAFVGLILVPALSSYGRIWEKAAAGFLSLFVLAALVLIGVVIGLAIVYYYDDDRQNSSAAAWASAPARDNAPMPATAKGQKSPANAQMRAPSTRSPRRSSRAPACPRSRARRRGCSTPASP